MALYPARKWFVAAVLAASFSGIVHAQQTIELKISHYAPTIHGVHFALMEPWARAIEKRTNGKVSFKIFSGASPLGKNENQLDQVQSGVVDVAFGLAGIPRGRLPRTLIIEMPFLVETAEQGARALMSIYPKYLKDEYKGLKVLLLMTHNAGVIHTRDKKLEKMEDLVGLRLRTPSPMVSAMFTQMGATPVGMAPTAVYEALQRGVVDGAAFPWDPVRAWKIDEVTKFHLEAKFYTAAFWYAMNEKKYNSLPADVRKAIDEYSGEYLVSRAQGWWDEWDAAGRKAAEARNNTITTLSPAERERWKLSLISMYNKQMIELEGQGIKNAREIYFEMQRQVERYAKK